ncbi:PREDICTED: uncharacterized protein LOC109587561 [Amphimedon queenslandica]|uniref:Uncharacterized protein n=1 Tax=Amphimedon queenslandica TaxID=400682 RepID=A0AAN0JQP9_AMPQE|nr:PREDICTED: uncharacterized protein LOC109587561 [Amphimedon queenslandica]|eukprot:XP_019859353.1 PREDICTED: uncharacterized protein LOC109587561 [Amphimedon queenslandica]
MFSYRTVCMCSFLDSLGITIQLNKNHLLCWIVLLTLVSAELCYITPLYLPWQEYSVELILIALLYLLVAIGLLVSAELCYITPLYLPWQEYSVELILIALLYLLVAIGLLVSAELCYITPLYLPWKEYSVELILIALLYLLVAIGLLVSAELCYITPLYLPWQEYSVELILIALLYLLVAIGLLVSAELCYITPLYLPWKEYSVELILIALLYLLVAIGLLVSAELCYITPLYLPWKEYSVELILIALLYLLVAIGLLVSAELCYITPLYLPWKEYSVELILIALLYLLVAIGLLVSAELCYITPLYLPWQEYSVELILIALLYLLVAIGLLALCTGLSYFIFLLVIDGGPQRLLLSFPLSGYRLLLTLYHMRRVYFLLLFATFSMYLSVCISNEIIIVPWTIIQQSDDISFSALFLLIKSGSISGICPSEYLTRCFLVKVYVGQSQDVLNIVEMGQSVIGVCSIFGCFIKFEVDRELWMPGEPLEANEERQLPLFVTEKTRKDKMFNVIVEFCQSNGLFWDEPDRYGKPFLTDFCNTLWYIDGHHEVFASRSCSIPILFLSLSGFNKPELSKHRKRSISNMNREKLIEYATVLQEYATSSWIEQPQFTTFKPALFQLIESLLSYASYLSMRNKAMKLHHSSSTPSVNFSDASTVRYLPPCVSFSPLVKNINDVLITSNVYQIIHVNNLAPKSPRQRYLYVRELKKGFSVPCFFFTYSHGSNVGNYHFIWRAPEGGNGESSHTQNMRLVEDIKKEIPVYHTRAMKQEFYNLIGRVSRNSKPYLLRSIYQSLSGDNSASRTTAEEEIDKRLIEVFSAEDPEIIVDLRELNTNLSDNYSTFWEKCSMFLSECTAVHERRHDTVVFMAKAISIRDLLQEVSKLCPTGTPIPSKSWVQLNFCPRNPCTHSSKRYTSKLQAKHIVQKRQFRKSHPDSHYCAALFRYMRDYAVKYHNLSLFVCIDDKHTIKVGEPGFPLAAAERGREVIVSTSNTFVVGDHDFSKFKITPSVTLLVDIPDSIEGSFYTGQVFIGLKDSVFEPSSPIRHATELYKILLRRMSGRSILFVYSDGGPDHRLTYLTVQLSLIYKKEEERGKGYLQDEQLY